MLLRHRYLYTIFKRTDGEGDKKMRKKLLFGSILAVILILSMPFISTLQAAPVSVVKTTTITANDQTATSTTPSIDSVEEATAALLLVRMSTSDPEVQALASQGIALMQEAASTATDSFCVVMKMWIVGLGILLAIARAANEAAHALVLVYEGILAGLFVMYNAHGCGIPDDNTNAISISSTSTHVAVSPTGGDSPCAQQ